VAADEIQDSKPDPEEDPDNFILTSNARPLFRILAGILGLLYLVMSIGFLFEIITVKDSPLPLKAPLAWLGCGIVFLIVACRGALIKKRKK
jgi:hypothetical protein